MINENEIAKNLKQLSNFIDVEENKNDNYNLSQNEEEEEEEVNYNIPKKEKINIYKSNYDNNKSNYKEKNDDTISNKINDKLSFAKEFDILLKENTNILENKINTLEKEINNLKENNIDLNLKNENNEEIINELTINNSTLIKDNENKNNKINTLNKEIKVYLNLKYEKQMNEKMLHDEINKLKKECINSNDVINTLQMKINDYEKITLEKDEIIKELTESNNKLIEEKNNLISNNKENFKNYENKIYDDNNNFIQEIEKKNQEIYFLKDQLKTFEENLNIISELNIKNENLKNENWEIIELSEKLDKQLTELKKDYEAKNNNTTKLNKENCELNQIIIDSFKKLNNLNQQNESYFKSIKEFEKDKKINSFNYINSIDEVSRKLEKYSKLYEENLSKIKDLEDVNQKLSYQVSEKNKESYNLIEELDEKKEKIIFLEENQLNLENLFQEVNIKNNELSEKLSALLEDNDSLNYCIENYLQKSKFSDEFFEVFIEKLKDITSNEDELNNLEWVKENIIDINIIEKEDWIEEMTKAFTFLESLFSRIIAIYKDNALTVVENEKIINDKEKTLFEYRTEINKIKSEQNSANWFFKEEKSKTFNKDIIINSTTNLEELKNLIKEWKLTLEIIDDCFFDKNNHKINDLINLLEEIFNNQVNIKYLEEELIEINKRLKERDNYKIYISRFDSKNKEYKKKNEKLKSLILERDRMKNDIKSYFIVYKQRLDNKNYNLIDSSHSKKVIESKDDNNENSDNDFDNLFKNDNSDALKKILNVNFINKIIKK